jgi:signal peptidase I
VSVSEREGQVLEQDARDALPHVTTREVDDEVDPELVVPSSHLWGEAKSLIRDFLFAALTAILLIVFVIQPVKVEGTSMLPHLHSGERIFVNKFVYSLENWPSERFSFGRPIERGDIVVFWYPGDPNKSFVKRVIGLPGETVRIDTDGHVFIDGERLAEPYLSTEYTKKPQRAFTKRIKEHRFFVMGDNRDASYDSRGFGLVPERYIYGKAWFRYWPVTEAGSVE